MYIKKKKKMFCFNLENININYAKIIQCENRSASELFPNDIFLL